MRWHCNKERNAGSSLMRMAGSGKRQPCWAPCSFWAQAQGLSLMAFMGKFTWCRPVACFAILARNHDCQSIPQASMH